ncbi:MAG: alpha/beta hydrolase [Clostridia bacterium]|nr:alpha/beta hydrolase [Clostridia bacterium]
MPLPVKILLIVLAIFVAIMLICFVFTYYIFKKAFGRSNKSIVEDSPLYSPYIDEMHKSVDSFKSLPLEEVWITSNDNLKLFGYLYEVPNAKATAIFMHGYHGHGICDFSVVLKYFIEKNISILIPDQRTHGKSEGKYLTFGVRESEDCALWAHYVAKRFPSRPIHLHGLSMGGAVVGMASAENLPKEVKTIFNDCGFTSPDAIIASVRKQMKLPAFPFQYYVRFLAKVLAKFSLKEKNAADCYAKCDLPCFFLHGEADNFVPCYMGKENYSRCKSKHKYLLTVEGAGHALAYMSDREHVTGEISDFLDTYLLN